MREAGFEPVLLPLSETRLLDPAPPEGPVAGLIATSRHAVPWLRRHFGGSGHPVLAVGEATASRLRDGGFRQVIVGPGRAGDLAALAASLPISPGARFLHAAGRVRLSDLDAGFAAAGLPLDVAEVYDTVPRTVSPEERARLRGEAGTIAGALLLSRGQARGLDALLREEGGAGEGLTFFCLSRAIALELSPQFGKNAIWADHPSLASLIETIKRWNGRLGR
ncbi:uroporphyrinogen-III synthase [Aureimonas ureilytica]|uniref:uroporphyrinogen-III synthase n=1 Tax=Aureimonas ureilytica TaxID=401562 RepID=UPI003CFA1B72